MPKIPVITKVPSGAWAMLAKDFTVRVWRLEITVYRGFWFDGASIPGLLQGLVGSPWDPLTLAAALVHDWIYASHALWKWLADLIFYALMRRYGVPRRKAIAFWWAVSRFGADAWYGHDGVDNAFARAKGSWRIITKE